MLFSITFSGCGGGGGSTGTVAITAIATTTAQSLTVGTTMTSFSPLTPSGGANPYTYSYTGTLPTGLSFNASTGAVTGTPTVVYVPANLVFAVKDANNVVASTNSTVIFIVSLAGTRQMGVSGHEIHGQSTMTDANGNVYVVGQALGGLDGNNMIGTPFDGFLTKYDATGTKLYTKQIGVTGASTYGSSVATDMNGNVYVAGQTSGGLYGNILKGTADFFLIKYDSSGTRLYTKQLGVAGAHTEGSATATDASGNVYVVGSTQGNLDGNTLAGTTDFFLTKYNASGTKLYTKQLGVAGTDTYGSSVATDVSGNVYVTGHTTGGLDGNTLTGLKDFFFTKYDVTGARAYTMQVGVAGKYTSGNSVATDANGNIYVSGSTSGGLDGNNLTGTYDFFLTKYDVTGTKVYTKQMGVAGKYTFGYSVATDASRNVYVAGQTYGGLDGNNMKGTLYDAFLTKYDATGTKLFTKQIGVSGANTDGTSVATDTSSNAYVTGSTTGGLDGNTLTGTYDFFLMKFNSSGIKQ